MSYFDPHAFDAYESSGWEAVADAYHSFWSATTSQAIDPLLDAAEVGRGMRVLDVGTGPGDAAARAAARGAEATGVDASAAMVAIATARQPAARFVCASVTQLPLADASFDAAVGNVVIQHVGEPERAAAELARVLALGGRVALSTWDGPERSPFFAAILAAVADAEVPPPSEIPPGPAFFEFADEATFAALLAGAGFADVHVGTATFEVPLDSPEQLVVALEQGTVRTGDLLRAADDAQHERLRESLAGRLEPWARGDGFAIPAAVKIASGRKPS